MKASFSISALCICTSFFCMLDMTDVSARERDTGASLGTEAGAVIIQEFLTCMEESAGAGVPRGEAAAQCRGALAPLFNGELSVGGSSSDTNAGGIFVEEF